MVTKEQFLSYIAVRDSGMTNMFDVKMVMMLSDEELSRDDCIYIMQNFEDLAKKYEVEI